MAAVDDGEIDFSDSEFFFSSCSPLPELPSLSELFKTTHACTHTHTCNPPGPDNEHTHTCYHTHTQLFSPDDTVEKSEDQSDEVQASAAGRKRALGNKEAVRKYRQKKKAQTTYLEEQVAHLQVLNQQLVRKLQSQAALEAEAVRLRSLLSEFQGRIVGELGASSRSMACVGTFAVEKDRNCFNSRDTDAKSLSLQCAALPNATGKM